MEGELSAGWSYQQVGAISRWSGSEVHRVGAALAIRTSPPEGYSSPTPQPRASRLSWNDGKPYATPPLHIIASDQRTAEGGGEGNRGRLVYVSACMCVHVCACVCACACVAWAQTGVRSLLYIGSCGRTALRLGLGQQLAFLPSMAPISLSSWSESRPGAGVAKGWSVPPPPG